MRKLKTKDTKKISEKTTLAEILDLPGAEEALVKYKVPCLTCPMAQFEMAQLTIGDICKMYNIDLETLVEALNKNK